MATTTTAVLDCLEKGTVPKSKRKLQKHLRSAGLAYISRTGKLIPAKKVADELCQCPHKCDTSVPMDARHRLFNHFYGLSDADMQNQFLRQHMDLRARLNVPETAAGGGRPPRRITCKYLIPLLPSENTVEVCQKAFVSAFVITTKRVRLQREKLISSLGLNVYSSHNRSKNGNNNNIHTLNNNITMSLDFKRNDLPTMMSPKMNFQLPTPNEAIDLTMNSKSETSLKHKPTTTNGRSTDNPLIPMGLLLPEGVTIFPVTASPDHMRDMAIVNNFFSNQLWKPEYIGAYS